MALIGPGADGELKYIVSDEYTVLTMHGEAILCIHDSKTVWCQQKQDLTTWLLATKGANIKPNLERAEWETLAEICDLPKIHITEFPSWRDRYNASNNRSKDKSGRDPGRESREGVPSGNPWWRMLGVQVRVLLERARGG